MIYLKFVKLFLYGFKLWLNKNIFKVLLLNNDNF